MKTFEELSPGQQWLLNYVRSNPGQSPSEIAEAQGADARKLQGIILSLRNMGFVEFKDKKVYPADPDDVIQQAMDELDDLGPHVKEGYEVSPEDMKAEPEAPERPRTFTVESYLRRLISDVVYVKLKDVDGTRELIAEFENWGVVDEVDLSSVNNTDDFQQLYKGYGFVYYGILRPDGSIYEDGPYDRVEPRNWIRMREE